MTMVPTSFKNELDALSALATITSSLCQKLADLNIPLSDYPLPDNVDTLIPELTLAVPPKILAPLSDLSIPQDLLQKIIQRLERFIANLREEYTSAYRNACLESFRRMNSSANVKSIYQVYQSLIQRKFLPAIQAQVDFILTEVSKYQPSTSESKRPFNAAFIPVLEAYFSYNGYPSNTHRSILAESSRMSPRQIEVWFQNHRNRSKKEKKIVPRLDSDIPLKRAMTILHQNKYPNRLPTPSDDEESAERVISVKDSRTKRQVEDLDPDETRKNPNSNFSTFLDDSYSYRPPHAYPTKRSSSNPDPFPTDNGVFTFPPPIWRRKPATSPILSTAVDMDEFSQTFHLKLNLSENTRKLGMSSPKEKRCLEPWFLSTTTVPFRAPHPSLIQQSDVSAPKSFNSGSSLSSFVFEPAFGSTSLSASRPHLHFPSGEPSVRKRRPLPRRVPSSRSSPHGSRMSSFSSTTTSGNRSSSSSSNCSSPDLSTPPPLPNVELPPLDDKGQHRHLFDPSGMVVNPDLSNIYPLQNFNPTKFIDTSIFADSFLDFSHNLGGEFLVG